MKKQKKILIGALLTAAFLSQACPAWAITIPDGYSVEDVERREGEYNTYLIQNLDSLSGTWKKKYCLTFQTIDIAEKFVADNIKPEMSDFEKEMTIIKWMSDHITYDMDNFRAGTIPQYDYTPIYPLEIGWGVCSGYTQTFELLATLSGLTVKSVSGQAINNGELNGGHAWNQICLDGEWYNLDVTWADNDESKDITLRYVNATDSVFAEKHEWDRSKANACNAEKYAITATEPFFKEKKWRYSIYPNGSKEEMNRIWEASWDKDRSVFDDESYRAFYYSSVDQTAREIIDYISGCIENKEDSFSFKIFYPESMNNVKIFQSDGNNIGITTQISRKVAAAIDAKYKGVAFKSRTGQVSQTRGYEARNGYWMTYISNKFPRYKKNWKSENAEEATN